MTARFPLLLIAAGILVLQPACATEDKPASEGDATAATPSGQPEAKAAEEPAPEKAPSENRRRRLRPTFDLAGESEMSPGKGTYGSTRGAEDPVILRAPLLGRIHGASPRFEWDVKGADGRSLLIISDAEGRRVFSKSSGGTALSPPPPEGGWQPGATYTWQVMFRSPSYLLSSAAHRFTVIDGDERAAVERALAALPPSETFEGAMGRARVFREAGLWFEALGAYADVIDRFSDRLEGYEERGQVYWQLEATKEHAERDWAAADGLAAGLANAR